MSKEPTDHWSGKKTSQVLVASGNPVKVDATRAGFVRVFPDYQFEVNGQTVPSQVAASPIGNEEDPARGGKQGGGGNGI